MTLAGVAAQDYNPVCPAVKGVEHKFRVDHARAQNPDDPDSSRVLYPGNTCKVGSCVSAPVAAEGYYFWFKVHGLGFRFPSYFSFPVAAINARQGLH
jgi:hypothetical protein